MDENDEEREAEIRKLGIDIMRFTNEKVLNDVQQVVREIMVMLERKK